MSAYYSNMLPTSSLTGAGGGSTGGAGGNSSAQDSLYTPGGVETKFDPSGAVGATNFFSNGPSSRSSYVDNCGPTTPEGFPRYPPFDRLDSMNATGLVTKPGGVGPGGFMSTASSTSYAHHTGLTSYSIPGQTTPSAGTGHHPSHYDDPVNCKLPSVGGPGDTSPLGGSGGAGSMTSPMTSSMTSLQGSGSALSGSAALSAQMSGHPAAHAHHHMMSPFNPASPISGMVNGMHVSQPPQNIPIYPWMRPMNGGMYGKYNVLLLVLNT